MPERSSYRTMLFSVILCLAVGSPSAAAQPTNNTTETPDQPPTERDWLTFTVYWENDGTFVKPNNDTDRHYTNGTAISLTHHPRWAQDLADVMPFAEQFGPARTAVGYTLGHIMFTPENITATQPIPDDHPYAGYLYAGVYWQRANDVSLDHFQLDLGVVGPSSRADDMQDSIHFWREIDRPKGWDNQHGDQFTVQAYLRKKWRLDLLPTEADQQAFGIDLIPQAGVALGTVFRHIEGGAVLRIGLNLPDDFGPGRLADLGAATGEPGDGFVIYGFARVGGRMVEHDLLMEGKTFDVEEETLVGEIQAGLLIGYHTPNFSIEGSYSQTFKTREFENQRDSDAYGAFMLGCTFRF
ncbi:MAG: lipid A deacylase LpxR family protein [Phycisphaerales bacterium]|nr:lipid A deacylase LpxR family protein [Phycisphaerales bacterium]